MLVTITWNAGFGQRLTPGRAAQLRLEGVEPSVSQPFDLDLPPGDPRTALEALFEATNTGSGPLWQAMTQRGLPQRRDHTALSVGDTVTLGGTVWRCDPRGWSQVVARVLRQPDEDVARQVLEMLRSGRAPGMVGATSSQRMSAQSALIEMGGRGDLAEGIGSWTAQRIEAWRDTEIAWLAELSRVGEYPTGTVGIARAGLALCDCRVRDSFIVAVARSRDVAAATAWCWTIATAMPQPFRAPAATLAALGEWLAGADPRPTLAWATQARPYQLASQLGSAYEAGRRAEDVMAVLAVVSAWAARHGAARDTELSRAGQALTGAGWSVSIDDPGAGYLNHGTVAAARYDTTAQVVRFPAGSRFEQEWDGALSGVGVDANTAIQALRRLANAQPNTPSTTSTQAARRPVQGVAGEPRPGQRRTGPTR